MSDPLDPKQRPDVYKPEPEAVCYVCGKPATYRCPSCKRHFCDNPTCGEVGH